MSNTSNLEKTLDSFLKNEANNVLFLRGEWGIGKTYFWKKYILEKIDKQEVNNIAYSYVSLFGVESIRSLKHKIQNSAKITKSKNEYKKAIEGLLRNQNQIEKLLFGNKFRWLGGPFRLALRIMSRSENGIVDSELFEELNSQYTSSLILNYLICIDDLERKEDNMTMTQVMGLIDELNLERKCKIIVILNEEKLEGESDKNFKKYREKVADIEVEYTPTPEENLRKVFSGKEVFFREVLGIMNHFKSSNIRILKRLRSAIQHIDELIKNCEPSLQSDIAAHLAFFCWAYLDSSQDLPLSFIRQSLQNYVYMLANMRSDKNSKRPENEEKWLNDTMTGLPIRGAAYDEDLVDLIQYGFLPDEVRFKSVLEKANKLEKTHQYSARVREVHDMYSRRLSDNEAQIIAAARQILGIGLERLYFNDFNFLINLLDCLKEDTSTYVEDYVSVRPNVILAEAQEDFVGGAWVKNEFLISKMKEFRDRGSSSLNLDIVSSSLASKRGWSEQDIDFLISLSPEQIHEWIKEHSKNGSEDEFLFNKIKNGLMIFGTLNPRNDPEHEKYNLIFKNTKKALLMLASESNLNRMRVEDVYGISSDELN